MQLRKRSTLGLLLSSALILTAIPANAATLAGTTCSKAGSTKTVSGKKYTCIKSGKKLIWDKGVTVKTTAPNTSPAIQAQLGARMANIAAVQLLADRLWSNSQGLKVDNPTAKQEKSANTATRIAAAKTARQMILSFSPMFPNFDLSEFPAEAFTTTNVNLPAAHGTFHLAQDFFAKSAGGIDLSLVPAWYHEGSAAMFATMVASEISKKNPNYATIAATNTAEWSKQKCQASYESWRTNDSVPTTTENQCERGLGQIMSEALINKSDALDKVLLVYQMIAIGNSFSEAIKYAFGVDKETFFNEMDSLLISLKW